MTERLTPSFGLAAALLALSIGTGPTMAQSLYDEATFKAPVADVKARRVGDMLTVQIVENASATANADTATRRRNDMNAALSHPSGPGAGVGLVANGEFDGGGRTARTGRLLAQLTVVVRSVEGNGDLNVRGEQSLLINDELQRIQLEGRVRPQDISDGNVVLSNRIADARIHYVGEGDLASRQKAAWWRQLLDWLGL